MFSINRAIISDFLKVRNFETRRHLLNYELIISVKVIVFNLFYVMNRLACKCTWLGYQCCNLPYCVVEVMSGSRHMATLLIDCTTTGFLYFCGISLSTEIPSEDLCFLHTSNLRKDPKQLCMENVG